MAKTPRPITEDMTREQRAILQLVRSSVEIMVAARNNGFLDADFEPIDVQDAARRMSGLKGFQADVVRTLDDIAEEVDFWKGPAAGECLAFIGIGCDDPLAMLRQLDRAARRKRQRPRRKR